MASSSLNRILGPQWTFEAGIPPRQDKLSHFLRDPAFSQEHPKDFVLINPRCPYPSGPSTS